MFTWGKTLNTQLEENFHLGKNTEKTHLGKNSENTHLGKNTEHSLGLKYSLGGKILTWGENSHLGESIHL
jgi:hypothetical protein